MSKTISVAFASDDVLAMPMTVAIASLLATRAPDTMLDIHALSCGISKRSEARVRRTMAEHGKDVATLTWHPIEGARADLLQKLYTKSDRPYPPAAYARLLLGELLHASTGKVIELDSDVVATTDLGPLWDMPMDDVDVLAITDLPHDGGHDERLRRTLSPEDVRRYGLDAYHGYFQSGVLVLALGPLRAGLDRELLDLLQRYPQLTFPDQDALNVVFAARHRLIDPRWNAPTASYWYKEGDETPYPPDVMQSLRETPFIIHFSGRPKPWEPGSTHPLAHRWQTFFEMTAWTSRKRTLLTRAIDRIPRARRVIGKRLRRLLKS